MRNVPQNTPHNNSAIRGKNVAHGVYFQASGVTKYEAPWGKHF